jgi:hypothetical protein
MHVGSWFFPNFSFVSNPMLDRMRDRQTKKADFAIRAHIRGRLNRRARHFQPDLPL